jgi:hypothetical protein
MHCAQREYCYTVGTEGAAMGGGGLTVPSSRPAATTTEHLKGSQRSALAARKWRSSVEPWDIYPDTYRRWRGISALLESDERLQGLRALRILDVGGSPDNEQLKLILPYDIEVANPAYNGIDGTDLPFPDRSFDVVICIDTLEHVPPNKRDLLIGEVVRTARRKTLLACPFDEPFVSDLERAIFQITLHPMLAEHLQFGLPSLEETLAAIRLTGCAVKVHDNDSLLGWASWLLLHQTVGGMCDLRDFDRLLNRVYDTAVEGSPSYRKILEIDRA